MQLNEATLLAAFGMLCAASTVARVWPRLEGNKHDAVLALAGALWHEGWTLDAALGLLLPAMELDGSSEPHREAAIRDTWEEHDRPRFGWPTVYELLGPLDGKAYQRSVELVPTTPRGPAGQSTVGARPLTDLGNAERLFDRHGEDIRFVRGIKWIQWDAQRWDSAIEPVGLMADTVRQLARQAAEEGQPTASKWAHQSESASRLRAAIGLAKDMPEFQLDTDLLDANPWLLNSANGIVDLRTGVLHEHHREHFITKATLTPYTSEARAPRFVQFLGEVFCGDWELARYVLRYLGYSLTGSVREQVFQLWVGAGANGKSTLIDTVRYVMGDYAQTLASDLLVERRHGRASEAASPDVARLRGSRLAAGMETKPGQRWNESLVKQLTGGDRVVARHLHAEPIEFEPTWKLILGVNHKPIVRGTDRGIWRRIHVVPFGASFDRGRGDPNLAEKLRDEAPGILSLLVAACLEWQQLGLQPPQRVREAVDDYRENQDVVGLFLSECTQRAGTYRAPKSKLYAAYRQWCAESSEYCLGKHAFNNELRERKWAEVCDAKGVRNWQGMRLRSDAAFGARAA